MSDKKLGFGCMRLPLSDAADPKSIDKEQTNRMIDTFLERGFTYFDTAYMYHARTSEFAVKECLVKRHPRDSYTIATKMPTMILETPQQQVEIFDEQLEKVGVEYFDYYLVHNLNVTNYETALRFETIPFLLKKKEEGYIRKLGFSFHADAKLLERILTEYPAFDFVQLQINYLDWESGNIQSRKCYETARRHGKDIIVMEPVKGGTLASLPSEAEALFRKLDPEASPASFAIRFAAGLEGVKVVLSGMSNYEQLLDNTEYMQHFKPLTEEEFAAIHQVRDIINAEAVIPCTGCRYCVEGDSCPQHIAIPEYFSIFNENRRYAHSELPLHRIYYRNLVKNGNGAASTCIGCKQCERACPQQLKITDHLKVVVSELENE